MVALYLVGLHFMNRIWRSLQLSTRILLVVAALSVASIWGLAARVATVLQADIEKAFSVQLTNTVGYVAADIDAKLQLHIDLLNDIAAAITPAVLADHARLQRLLEQRHVSPVLFPSGVTVSNSEGVPIAEFPKVAGRVGGSIADRDFFQGAMKGAKVAIGKPVMGGFVKRVLVGVSVPLRNASGQVAGVLTGALFPSDTHMFGLLEKTTVRTLGYFLVMSPRDNVIVSATDKNQIMKPLSAPGTNTLFDQQRQGMEGPARGTGIGGVEVISVAKRIGSSGWMLIGAIPVEAAFAPIAHLKTQIYLAALALSLLTMAALYFVLKRQLAPLGQMTAAIGRMTEGKENFAPLPGGGTDEIGQLVQSFNRLAVERGRLEDTLHQRELQSRDLLDALPIGIGRVDSAERWTSYNRLMRETYSRDSHDVIGRTMRDVIGEETYAIVTPYVQRALSGEDVEFDRSFVDADGRPQTRWVRYRPDRSASGDVTGLFISVEDVTTRKQAEAALAAQTKLLRLTFDNMTEGIAIFDGDLRLSAWNRRYGELLEYPASLLQEGTPFADLSRFTARRGNYGPGDPEEQVRSRVEEASHLDARRFRRMRQSGQVLEISAAPLPGGGFVVAYTNITQLQQAEIARGQSEERLRLVVDNLAEGVVVQDESGAIISANPAAQRLLGLDEDQLRGRTSIDPRRRAIREDGSEFPDELRPARQTLRSGEATSGVIMGVRKPDGTLSWLSINSRLLPMVGTSAPRGVVSSFADVTEQKIAAARQRLAASMFDHAAEAIIVTDRNNDILSVNPSFTEITGYTEQEVIGRKPRMFNSGLQSRTFYEEMWASIRTRGRWAGEIWGRRKNGDSLCLHLSISTVRDEKGDIVNYCSMFSDITARKDAEAALQRLNAELEQRVADRTEALEQANREMQSFSYSISHDLRAPLRAITGFSRIVLETASGKVDQDTNENLQRISAAAERMGRLIDDLLNLSKISRESVRRQPVDLSRLADAVASRLAEVHPARRVEVSIAPGINIDGDPGLIQIALENLIANAWKFTLHTADAKIAVGELVRDGERVFFVRDNGAGFDMRYAGKLFSPFQRLHGSREFEGTGIGLSIVQRIVAKHGGRIWAEAAPGLGATFHFTLGQGAQTA